MPRRAAIVVLAGLVAGCGGHDQRAPSIDRVLAAGGSFTLDGAVKIDASGFFHLLSAPSIPVHLEGSVSRHGVEAEGLAISGLRFAAFRRALADASWSHIHEEPLPSQAHVELDLSRRELESVLGGELPGRVQRAHVSADLTFRRR